LLKKYIDLAYKFNDLLKDDLDEQYRKPVYIPKAQPKSFTGLNTHLLHKSKTVGILNNKTIPIVTKTLRDINLENVLRSTTNAQDPFDYKNDKKIALKKRHKLEINCDKNTHTKNKDLITRKDYVRNGETTTFKLRKNPDLMSDKSHVFDKIREPIENLCKVLKF